MSDRIELRLAVDVAALAAAVESWKRHIAEQVLASAVEVAADGAGPPEGGAGWHTASGSLPDGATVTIGLRRDGD